MLSENKSKVVYTSHVCFDERGFVIEPNFEAVNNEVVKYQNNQSRNKDVKRLRSGLLAIDHVYDDSGSDAELVQADKLPSVIEDDNVVDAFEVSEPPFPTPAKRRRPKDSKNRTVNNTLFENRRSTYAYKQNLSLILVN